MRFNEESAIVKIWVRRIIEGENTREQIPKLGNLTEVVTGILDKQTL